MYSAFTRDGHPIPGSHEPTRTSPPGFRARCGGIANCSDCIKDVAEYWNAKAGRPAEFHDVLMVAFDIRGLTAQRAQEWLMDGLPDPGKYKFYDGDLVLDSWWFANDERFDGSDTDSAVFVRKGCQKQARKLLREHGLVD